MRLLAHTFCWDFESLGFSLRNRKHKAQFKNLQVRPQTITTCSSCSWSLACALLRKHSLTPPLSLSLCPSLNVPHTFHLLRLGHVCTYTYRYRYVVAHGLGFSWLYPRRVLSRGQVKPTGEPEDAELTEALIESNNYVDR